MYFEVCMPLIQKGYPDWYYSETEVREMNLSDEELLKYIQVEYAGQSVFALMTISDRART